MEHTFFIGFDAEESELNEIEEKVGNTETEEIKDCGDNHEN
ncbi:MAG: hypothetical protein QXP36_05245 [Conexivisphaerales archaeon]